METKFGKSVNDITFKGVRVITIGHKISSSTEFFLNLDKRTPSKYGFLFRKYLGERTFSCWRKATHFELCRIISEHCTLEEVKGF